MAAETNSEFSLTNYITSRKRARLDPQLSMELPPLPFQFITSLRDDNQLRCLQSDAASTSTAPIDYDHDLFASNFHHSAMDFDAYHLHLRLQVLG
jgi:hypothetical protein